MKINDITGEIVDSSLEVHKSMGAGLYEKVYEDCLFYCLEKKGLNVKRQSVIDISFQDLLIKNAFKIDLLVEEKVVVELKSVDKFLPIHEAQILNYMRLTGTAVGLLINFNVPLIKEGIKKYKI